MGWSASRWDCVSSSEERSSPAPDVLTHTIFQGRGRVGEGFGKRAPAAFPEVGVGIWFFKICWAEFFAAVYGNDVR